MDQHEMQQNNKIIRCAFLNLHMAEHRNCIFDIFKKYNTNI